DWSSDVCSSDLVADVVLEVVEGDAERGEGRRPDDARGARGRALRGQEAGAAALEDLGRRAAGGGVVLGDADRGAVGTEIVVARLTPPDARVDLTLVQEARQVAQAQLVQARSALRSALDGEKAHRRDELPQQDGLPHRVRFA